MSNDSDPRTSVRIAPSRVRAALVFGCRTALASALISSHIAVWSRCARADEPNPAADESSRPAADVVEARRLFLKGKELAAQNNLIEACTAFEESQALDPEGGTLLNLADCRTRMGAYASALEALEAARILARRAGRDDAEGFIRGRLDELSKKVVRLRIELAPPRAAGLELRVDGRKVGADSELVELAVDNGSHTVDVIAPEYQPYHTTLKVSGEGASVTLPIPPLDRRRVIAPSNTSPKPGPSRVVGPSPMRIAGYSFVAAGGASLVLGLTLGAVALSRSRHAESLCPHIDCASFDGVVASHDATALAAAATGAFIAGAVLTVTGVTLVVVPPSSPKRGLQVSAEVQW